MSNSVFGESNMALDMRALMAEMLAEERARSSGDKEKSDQENQERPTVPPADCPLDNSDFALRLGGDCLVSKGPGRAHLLEQFVSEAEERQLLAYFDGFASADWVQLARRRLLHFEERAAAALTPTVRSVVERCRLAGVRFGADEGLLANHVLVNEYEPGQGLCSHQDGPAFAPTAAIVSLGSALVLRFTASVARDAPTVLAVLLPPRSLFVFGQALYTQLWHGIDELYADDVAGMPPAQLVLPRHYDVPLNEHGCLLRRRRLSLTVRYATFIE